MKRHGFLYERVCSYENLELAFHNASRNKRARQEIKEFASKLEANLLRIQKKLQTKTYQTSRYTREIIYEPKEREIFKLPFKDRVVHWAIMNVVVDLWIGQFTEDTYACIKGKGIHACVDKLKTDLRKDPDGTRYCLKLDVTKFYPSIDHDILKTIIRRKIKDPDLLWLLDSIIDTEEGVPIGNYLSQFFANLYLAELDHILKEELRVPYYYRYADDLVLLGGDKGVLSSYLVFINHYLHESRNLDLKRNYQIFPVDSRGLDFIGYRFYHTHTLLRKSLKKNLCRTVAKVNKQTRLTEAERKQRLCSHYGWAKHSNSINLLKTVGMTEFKKFSRAKFKTKSRKHIVMDGTKTHVSTIFFKNITILNWAKEDSIYEGLRIKLHYEIEEDVPQPDGGTKKEMVRHITFFWSEPVFEQLESIEKKAEEEGVEDPFPMRAKFKTQETTKGNKKGVFYYLDDPDD